MRRILIETVCGGLAILLGTFAVVRLANEHEDKAGDQVVYVVVEDIPIIITAGL